GVTRGAGPRAEGPRRGSRLPGAQTGGPAGSGRARRRVIGRGGGSGAVSGPRRARRRRRSGRLAPAAALAFAVTGPALAKARPVAVTRPVTVARTLAGQWRRGGRHRTLCRAPGRRDTVGKDRDPPVWLLTLTL